MLVGLGERGKQTFLLRSSSAPRSQTRAGAPIKSKAEPRAKKSFAPRSAKGRQSKRGGSRRDGGKAGRARGNANKEEQP
jgi:hypothetical protein